MTQIPLETLYAFLKASFKPEYFEDRNATHWPGYAVSITHDYMRRLERNGFASIPRYENRASVTLFFDQHLFPVEGERLDYALRGDFLNFPRKALLDRMVVCSGTHTTSAGQVVVGCAVEVARSRVALVWSEAQDTEGEQLASCVATAAIRNSSSTSSFVKILKANRSGLAVETYL